MPLSITLYNSSDTLDQAGVESRLADIEAFINGGIVNADLGSGSPRGAFVDTDHLPTPEFYGRPTPRCIMHSGDTVFRTTTNAAQDRFLIYEDVSYDQFVPIPGLCATIPVTRPPNGTRTGAELEVWASWHAWENNGKIAVSGATYSNYERYRAARFALFLNGTELSNSRRRIEAGTTTPANLRQKTHCLYRWIAGADLPSTPGYVNVGVRVQVQLPSSTHDWMNIFVSARSFIVAGHTFGS